MLRFSVPIAAVLVTVSLLASCGGGNGFFRGEGFEGSSKHQHVYQATPERVCEAARSVMLGEGYVLRPQAGGKLALVGVKEFKADEDSYSVLELHASCQTATKGAVLYVTAIEARIDAKQSKSSTSIGVPFTPLSIASSSTAEVQIKSVGQTVEDWGFYTRFYAAVTRLLGGTH